MHAFCRVGDGPLDAGRVENRRGVLLGAVAQAVDLGGLEFSQALQAWPSFDRGKSYLLYCDFGLLSAHLAEMMRKAGFRAFHFRGGTRVLRKSLESGSR